MKMPPAKFLVLATAFALFLSPSAFAKKKPADFSDFRGNYTGTLALSAFGQAYSGTVTTSISVPKNGKSATISFLGSIYTGQQVPLPVTITLTKNGAVAVSDAGVGLGFGTLYPSTGVYRERNDKLTFSAVSSFLTLNVQGTVKDQGKKRNLKLLFTIYSPGGVITFVNTLTAKAPKDSK